MEAHDDVVGRLDDVRGGQDLAVRTEQDTGPHAADRGRLPLRTAQGDLHLRLQRDDRRLDTIERRGDSIIDDEQRATYVETFSRTGFGPGINWYRNIDANVAAAPDVGRKPLDLPCLMLCAEWDPALPPAMAADMPERCSDLEMHIIEQAGHFVQLEKPEAVSTLLVDWLTRRFPPNP